MGPLTVRSWSAYDQLTVRDDPPPSRVFTCFSSWPCRSLNVIVIVDTAIQTQWRIFDQLSSRTELKCVTRRWRKSDSGQKYREKLATSDFFRLHRSMRWGWWELQNSNSTIPWYLLCRFAMSACSLYIKFFAYTTFHFRWPLYFIHKNLLSVRHTIYYII